MAPPQKEQQKDKESAAVTVASDTKEIGQEDGEMKRSENQSCCCYYQKRKNTYSCEKCGKTYDGLRPVYMVECIEGESEKDDSGSTKYCHKWICQTATLS